MTQHPQNPQYPQQGQPFNPQFPSGQYPPMPQQGQYGNTQFPSGQYPPMQQQGQPQGYPQQGPQGYPQQQNYQQFPQQPPMMQPPTPPRKKQRGLLIVGIIAAVLVFGCIGSALASHSNATTTTTTSSTLSNSNSMTQAPTTVLTKAIMPTPTPQSVHYPPTTVTDLHGLASKGTADAIHEFHSESVGLTGVCPQPKREVTVDPSVTGKQLAEDLLAYFYAQQLDSPCGSIIFAYHNQAESDNGYTAGRIDVTVTGSNGQDNIDPNATNLKHTLTLDIGGADANKEYVVTY